MAPNNGRRRRQMIVLLVASLAMLGWLLWGMVADLRSSSISYYIEYGQPVNPYLCPGDVLRYEVDVGVIDSPAELTITESWCEKKPDGLCNRATTQEYRLGILRPRNVGTLASRVMPDLPFEPGAELEFWHTVRAITNHGIEITGYIVGPVYERDNCEGP